MAKLRVALIGLGAVTTEHIDGWTLAGNVICAAADPRATRPQVAKHLGIPSFASIEELLSKVPIDVIDICTPQHLHWPYIAVLKSWPGALVVEKPVVTNYRQLHALHDLLGVR